MPSKPKSKTLEKLNFVVGMRVQTYTTFLVDGQRITPRGVIEIMAPDGHSAFVRCDNYPSNYFSTALLIPESVEETGMFAKAPETVPPFAIGDRVELIFEAMGGLHKVGTVDATLDGPMGWEVEVRWDKGPRSTPFARVLRLSEKEAVSRETKKPETKAAKQTPVTEPQKVVTRDFHIADIEPNPWQPRTTFDETELQELAESIEARGLLQQIIVRPHPTDPDKAQIIDGERRYRAIQQIGWKWLTVIVRQATDEQMADSAIEANEQRTAMNPLDVARGYKRLMDEFGWTAARIAEKYHKSCPVISNVLRLLELPATVAPFVEDRRINEAQARAIVTYKQFPELAQRMAEVAANGTSSKLLEQKPTEWSEGLRHQLDVQTIFYFNQHEFEMCARCPFNAMRAGNLGFRVCLHKEHYNELNALWNDRRAREAEDRRAAQEAAGESRVAVEQRAEIEARNEAREQARQERIAQNAEARRECLARLTALRQYLPENILDMVQPLLSVIAIDTYQWQSRNRVQDILDDVRLGIQLPDEKEWTREKAISLFEDMEGLDLLCILVFPHIKNDTYNHSEGALAKWVLENLPSVEQLSAMNELAKQMLPAVEQLAKANVMTFGEALRTADNDGLMTESMREEWLQGMAEDGESCQVK